LLCVGVFRYDHPLNLKLIYLGARLMRQSIIAGNWKMFKTPLEAKEFMEAFKPLVASSKSRILLAVPFIDIPGAVQMARGSNIEIGAQNLSEQDQGAFTGEISGKMLKAAGVCFVLVGHSERRQLFQESNRLVHKKLRKALENGLTPILCFGETAADRDQGKTKEVLESQLSECLEGITAEDLARVVLAYEPIWAIGTGITATPDMAQEAHRDCRSFIKENWGAAVSDTLSILYGGSVKGDNIASLMAQEDIDGALVGGASLDPTGFSQIVNFT